MCTIMDGSKRMKQSIVHVALVVEDYDEAVRLDPRYAPAYAGRALSHALLGHEASAQKDIDRAAASGMSTSILEWLVEPRTETSRLTSLDGKTGCCER